MGCGISTSRVAEQQKWLEWGVPPARIHANDRPLVAVLDRVNPLVATSFKTPALREAIARFVALFDFRRPPRPTYPLTNFAIGIRFIPLFKVVLTNPPGAYWDLKTFLAAHAGICELSIRNTGVAAFGAYPSIWRMISDPGKLENFFYARACALRDDHPALPDNDVWSQGLSGTLIRTLEGLTSFASPLANKVCLMSPRHHDRHVRLPPKGRVSRLRATVVARCLATSSPSAAIFPCFPPTTTACAAVSEPLPAMRGRWRMSHSCLSMGHGFQSFDGDVA